VYEWTGTKLGNCQDQPPLEQEMTQRQTMYDDTINAGRHVPASELLFIVVEETGKGMV
jgi:hypothetical protein